MPLGKLCTLFFKIVYLFVLQQKYSNLKSYVKFKFKLVFRHLPDTDYKKVYYQKTVFVAYLYKYYGKHSKRKDLITVFIKRKITKRWWTVL